VKKGNHKNYHFTIVDIKSAAIARDLVVLMLLDELSELAHDDARAKSSLVLLCLSYTYLSAIMPSSLHEMLQEKISEVKDALEKDNLPPFIEVPDMYRADIAGYLDDWQRKVQQEYPVTRVQAEVVQTRERTEMQSLMAGRPSEWEDLPPGTVMASEQSFEAQTGALVLNAPYNDLLDPGLREAFDAFKQRGPKSAVKKAVKVIHDTWSTNPTFVDLAWEHSRDHSPIMDFDVGENPCAFSFKIMKMMVDSGPTSGFKPRVSQLSMARSSVFEFPAHWFISLAQSLKQM